MGSGEGTEGREPSLVERDLYGWGNALLTAEQVARRLGMRRDTVFRWIHGGELRAAKVAGKWWVTVEHYEDLLGRRADLRRKARKVATGRVPVVRRPPAVAAAPAGLRKRVRSRQTGHVVSVYYAPDADMDTCVSDADPGGLLWVTVCEEHGTVVNHRTRSTAEAHLGHPRGWCEACREEGEEPD